MKSVFVLLYIYIHLMKSQSFWLLKKNKPKILLNNIEYKQNNKSVLVKTLYSGISKGTEKLVANGNVHKSQFSIMKCPFQEGNFMVFCNTLIIRS